jgi:glutamate racemase
VGTARSAAYTRVLHALDSQLFVQEVACPDFVPLVESEAIDTPEAVRAAIRYLEPLLEIGTDTVVLGCTHYPFLLPVLQRLAPQIRFVDPAEQTVVELAREMERRHIAASRAEASPSFLTTTGDITHFSTQLHRFLPRTPDCVEVGGAVWEADRLMIAPSTQASGHREARQLEPR